jgi:hypothetical protein
MKKKKNYYVAHVLFENGHKSVLALESCETDKELVRMHFISWSRAFIGMELKILRLCSCEFCDYMLITTKIDW